MMGKSAGAMLVLVVLAGVGCRKPAQPSVADPAPVDTAAVADAGAAMAAGPLQDIVERGPAYLVGISFPKGLQAEPGVADWVRRYAQDQRDGLMQAVQGLEGRKPAAPFELSLGFEVLADTAELTVVAADGNRYTGGAHGEPLLARLVWLKRQGRPLTAAALVPEPSHWEVIGGQVARQLRQAAAARLQADGVPPEQQAALLASTDKMIAQGTSPRPENFAVWEPQLDAAGRIVALRFLFPPYQVGPYSDGIRNAVVPASVLRPLVAPEYAGLFSTN